MRKVVIITRNTDEYCNLDFTIGRVKKQSVSGFLFPAYVKYRKALSFFDPETQCNLDPKSVVGFFNSHSCEFNNNKKSIEPFRLWEKDEGFMFIPDILKSLFLKIVSNQNEIPNLYEQFSYPEIDPQFQVYLFYFNKAGLGSVRKIGQFLSVVCNDCGIDLTDNIEEDNILYVHDNEWHETGEKKMLWGHTDNDYDKGNANVDLLKVLKTKFNFIAMFQHQNRKGTHFNNILRCEFGCESLAESLKAIEDDSNNDSFEALYKACEPIVKND